MPKSDPSLFSIAFADNAAIGHISSGLELYKSFEKIVNEQKSSDGRVSFNDIVSLCVPAITNLTLGLELLLKVHHFQITGSYPRGHDIKKLGSSFPDETMTFLRGRYKQRYDDPNMSKGLEIRFSGSEENGEVSQTPSGEPDLSTYDLAIEYIGPMYVRWRYIYEELESMFDISASYAPLYFCAMSVHEAIRNYEGRIKLHW